MGRVPVDLLDDRTGKQVNRLKGGAKRERASDRSGHRVEVVIYFPPFRKASASASSDASSKSQACTYLYTPTSAFFSASYELEYSIFCLIFDDSGHQVISTNRSTDMDVFSPDPSTGTLAGKSNTQYRHSVLNFCSCSKKSAYTAFRGPVDSTSITCKHTMTHPPPFVPSFSYLFVFNVIDDVPVLFVLFHLLIHRLCLSRHRHSRRLRIRQQWSASGIPIP